MNLDFQAEEASRWERFEFIVNESEITSRDIGAINEAQKHGHLFKIMAIRYPGYREINRQRGWMAHFFSFMRILTKKSLQPQLSEIEFEDLKNFLRALDDPLYKYACMVIGNFLGSQCTLKTVCFRNCLFKYSYCCQILRKMILSNNGIEDLDLYRFLEYEDIDPLDLANEEILSEILRLPSLKKLTIDYRLILGEGAIPDQVFELLRNHRGQLRILIYLTVNEASTSFQQLTASHWNTLIAENQNLYVHITMTSNSTFGKATDDLIASEAPIRDLTFEFHPLQHGMLFNFSFSLSFFNTAKYLETLTLVFNRPIESADMSILIDHLNGCTSLQILELTLVDPSENLETSLNTLLQNPQALRIINLTIYVIEDQKQKLIDLRKKYKELSPPPPVKVFFSFPQET